MDEMDDVVFVSVAFRSDSPGVGTQYLEQQKRLRDSILKIYPFANLLFFYDTLPSGSNSFFNSLYGFKPHAIQAARDRGFEKIIMLDPAMILVDKVDDLLKYPVMAVRDDNKLHNWISDKCLALKLLTRKGVEEYGWHLVGGSLYFFDFTKAIARSVFYDWYMMERAGLFGSQYEEASGQLQGHRADETCMAIALYRNGVEPVDMNKARYCNEINPMFIKKHFK